MRSPELTLYVLLILSAIGAFKGLNMMNSSDNQIQRAGDRSMTAGIFLSLLFIWWMGQRQYFMGGYVDSANYAREYINLPAKITVPDFKGEWIWMLLMQICKVNGLSTSTFFTIVAAGYILPLIPAMKKFIPSNPFLGLLFVFSSLFFLPFGVNGIRNGLACNLLILGLTYLFDGKYSIFAFFVFLCYGIHHSVMLPIAACLLTIFYFRDVKVCVYLWLLSIVLSLFVGGWFINFFAGLGFDDRMAQYAQELDSDAFSQTGFRWDFLLYSAMPVYLSWYVCVKKRISDNWYNAIACTYIICNAFWVLVIRASYSNRFAYLSWFIYPLVIVYPLVLLPVWHDQDNRTGQILIAYIAFTFFMNFFWGAI